MKEDFGQVMRHHHAAWRAERIAWCVMALVLLATLLGAFGDGPLSDARVGSPRTFTVEYDRLLRSSSPALLRFRVQPTMAQGGVLRLRIDRSLLDRIEIESFVPEPEHQTAGPGYTEFGFVVAPDSAAATIDLRYRPATFGRFRGNLSIAGQHAVAINQFVYP